MGEPGQKDRGLRLKCRDCGLDVSGSDLTLPSDAIAQARAEGRAEGFAAGMERAAKMLEDWGNASQKAAQDNDMMTAAETEEHIACIEGYIHNNVARIRAEAKGGGG